MSGSNDLRAQARRRYAALAPRERVLVAIMGSAVAFLVVWLIAVRPAWNTLARAPALRAQADVQLLQLQALANEAAQLRALPQVSQSDAEQALKTATGPMGTKGKLTLQGDHATLAVTGANGEDLRQWLLQARSGAHARPTEVTLKRNGGGYDGTLVVTTGAPQ